MAAAGPVVVVGAGLAGAEAAWQLAQRGVRVRLYEMRPGRMTPAHTTGYFAELVCSNSLGAAAPTSASGLLKEEMRRLGSLVVRCADSSRVPAGGALAVDRTEFGRAVTEALERHPLVEVRREEVGTVPADPIVVVASGPLTSDALAEDIRHLTGREHLSFFDAVAPIVTLESLDLDRIFRSSRYDKGEPSYLNCPMTREEYERFWEALVTAERAPLHPFEKEVNFEGCLPIEVLARRDRRALLFGPLKPVGLTDPRTGRRPYAVVQLRQDNREGTLYNMVGFQTNLRWGEQRRVFRLIPGLERAEFVRYGVMHRNTYINAPALLEPTLQCRSRPGLFFAGQLAGVEGYMESAAAGLVAGLNAARSAMGLEPVVPPRETAVGALLHYIAEADPRDFRPMNVAFGLFPPLREPPRGKAARRAAYAERALAALEAWREGLG